MTIKSSRLDVDFRRISRLGITFIFLRLFKLTHSHKYSSRWG